ncbi:MAG: YicC family protein [Chlamydiales bacterium]|nr:YicC family protein [Chlamydiales bacterium]
MKKEFSLSSMTAYGQGEALSKEGRVTVEVQGVNRRFLEVNLNLPRALSSLEMEIRAKVAKHIKRGQLSLSLVWQREKKAPLRPNLPLARALKEGWDEIAAEVGGSFDLSLIAQERDLFVTDEEELPQDPVFEAIETALDHLVAMRKEEGEKLAQDLAERLSLLEKYVGEIERTAEGATSRYQEKLKARLAEFGSPENEERILREIVVYAERIDITEEVVRFKIHAEKFRKTMQEGSACGKKLDFLLQELIRESNTIGAKAQDTSLVVEIKSELEKMREQVQNVE